MIIDFTDELEDPTWTERTYIVVIMSGIRIKG